MNNKFDVFISFKNTDSNGQETRDQKIGYALHKALTMHGLRAFFCNSTLLSLGESVYKDAINDALDSSYILIIVSTSLNNLNSPWVRYEWGSFHDDILSGRKPHSKIISYLSGMLPGELPRELRSFESFNYETTTPDEVTTFVLSILGNRENSSELKSTATIKDRIEEEMQQEEDHLDLAKSRFFIQNNSDYSPLLKGEKERLQIQGQFFEEKEKMILGEAIKKIQRNNLIVLDYGSAFGNVAMSRFSDIPAISKIICVDINSQAIQEAREKNTDPKFSFYALSDGLDPGEDLDEIFRRENTDKVDVIFVSMVLQHVKEPALLVRRLSNLLKIGGFFYARNADDGTKVCYPDPDNILVQILKKYETTSGASDRIAGRKLQDHFRHAGLKEVKMIAFAQDTDDLDYEARELLYKSQFKWRLTGLKELYLQDVANPILASQYEWMKTALNVFHEMLLDDSFWYSFVDFGCIGWKKKRSAIFDDSE